MAISAATTWRAAVVGVAAVAAGVLVPDPAAWRALGAPHPGAVAHVDDLAALIAGAALWSLAVWVLVVTALATIASLPGHAGRLGRLLVRAAVPRALRGVVLGGLAGALVLGPTFAASALPVRPTGPAAVATSAVGTPGPAWPTSPPAPPTTPATPTSTPPAPDPPPVHPPAVPTTPSTPTTTATPAPATPPTPTSTAPGPTAVVVAPGDSLWSITASALTPAGGAAPSARQVAAAWPAWFAVNRAAIGPDPGLLQPGTHLTPPTTDGSTP